MSDQHRRRGRGADPHTLAGAYAMDAVTGEDRARFEQHLAGCETCQAELRGLRETTARLAAAAEVQPRAELREQTVRAAAQIRQLPPVTDPGPASPTPRWRHALTPAALTPAARATGAARGRRWLPRLAIAVAAAFALVAAGFGYAMHGAEHRLNMAQSRSHEIAAVLGAPDAQMMTARIRTGGSATVVMSHRASALVFTAADLRSLPAARSYQLWLMGPSGARSMGVLPAARNGMTGPMVISGLAPGDRVGLTVEPAGGSPPPTSAPIMMLLL
jgi:anti-sigma-K factor RskA